MSGHTPGPWHWVIEDASMATLGVGQDPGMGDPHVLSIGPCRSCAKRQTEWQWGKCLTPNEADAHLIASAPMLLEALQAILPFIPITSAEEGGASAYSENVRAADKVRAAIAAATGETK